MEYISSDTNIWLDFNSISRTDLPFRLPCTYIMYKEAIDREIITPKALRTDLLERGMLGVEISIDEFNYAMELSYKYVKLSVYDRTALAIAKLRNISLLSGDNALRKAALKEDVEVFGTIGLLDKLYDGGYINKPEYQFCLVSLLEHKERRLPIDELQKRLDLIRNPNRQTGSV